MIHASDIPRGIVLLTLGLVVVSLSLRRMLYRAMLYRRFNRGKGMRNVLIVGTGPQAEAIRHHMDSLPHLGYSFKGFIELSDSPTRFAATSDVVVGSLDTLFQHARQHFVDEVFVAAPCERGIVQAVLENARAHGVGLRVVPNIYYLLARNRPIEYIGHLATIPLHLCRGLESGLMFKLRPRDRERSQTIVALESHRREPGRTANQVSTFSGD
jgi:FlaA1/EpsC-like NDP-sugar epimerase